MRLVPCIGGDDHQWEQVPKLDLSRFPPIYNNDEIPGSVMFEECSKCGAVAWHGDDWHGRPFAMIVGPETA